MKLKYKTTPFSWLMRKAGNWIGMIIKMDAKGIILDTIVVRDNVIAIQCINKAIVKAKYKMNDKLPGGKWWHDIIEINFDQVTH